MNQSIPFYPSQHNSIKRKVTTMTTQQTAKYTDAESAELLKMRREKRRERRHRQLDSFYESMKAQNADKLIFLFDTDTNIA